MRCPLILCTLSVLLFTSSTFAFPKHSDIGSLVESGRIDPQVFDPNFVHFDCGNTLDEASKGLLHTHQQLHDEKFKGSAVAQRAKSLTKRQWTPVVVDTYIHIVTTQAKADAFTDDMWQNQLATMNQRYDESGFKFRLANVSKTVNDAWATASDFAPMQQELRKGPYSALNIWFLSDIAGGVLGVCSMPTNIGSGDMQPSVYAKDGCVVSAGTMPNGPIKGYNQGMTAVHETGHWLGLFHTFEGNSCDGDGDFIADTPAQSKSTSGCPTNKDSCPDKEGIDLVHNYMDYSTDACYTSFTPGQISRMQELWNMYRKDH